MPESKAERQTLRLRIAGMDCYSCSLVIRKNVEKMPGVVEIGVNYMMDLVSVTYNPEQTTREKIFEAIRRAGYEPIPLQ